MKTATAILTLLGSMLVPVLVSNTTYASDGLKDHLLEHLLPGDPVLTIPRDKTLLGPATEMALAAKKGDWKNPVFLSDQSYDYVLFAYYNDLIDRHQFIEIQDYLHILTDFSTEETAGFKERTHRIPALSIERLRPEDFQSGELKKLIKRSGLNIHKIAATTTRTRSSGHWITLVTVEPGFMQDYFEKSRPIYETCSEASSTYPFRCYALLFEQPEMQLMTWYELLSSIPYEIHYIKDNKIIFGSINHLLDLITRNSDSPDFLPLYGQLGWEDLIELREQRKNAGTIYHPASQSNNFTPHGIYGGATAFMRHDLGHQQFIEAIPGNHRRFYAWLHRQEQKVLKQLDQHFAGFNDSQNDAVYIGYPQTNNLLANTILREHYGSEKKTVDFETREYLWPHPGQHRDLFPGVFADMLFYYHGNKKSHSSYALAEFIGDAFHDQWKDAAFNFAEAFRLYTASMINLLRRNRLTILVSFGINIDWVLTLIEKDCNRVIEYPKGYHDF